MFMDPEFDPVATLDHPNGQELEAPEAPVVLELPAPAEEPPAPVIEFPAPTVEAAPIAEPSVVGAPGRAPPLIYIRRPFGIRTRSRTSKNH